MPKRDAAKEATLPLPGMLSLRSARDSFRPAASAASAPAGLSAFDPLRYPKRA